MSNRTNWWIGGIALSTGLVLGIGWMSWSSQAVHADGSGPSERELAELSRESVQLQQVSRVLSHIANTVTPAVVHIQSERTSPSRGRVEETGSGVIIAGIAKPGLFVVTNRHVIDGAELGDIFIQLDDGREIHPLEVLSDAATDLAVLRINVTGITPAKWGDSNEVDIGHLVLAMGSPFGLSRSVTLGIISAKGRRQLKLGSADVLNQDFLQTDAAINPGNSGGPLVDLQGRIIGINTAIASSSGGNEGIGFSIPCNLAQRVMEQLLEHGVVRRAYLGVRLDPQFDAAAAAQLKLDRVRGARVTQVYPNTPAAKAQLQNDDVVLTFDGIAVQDENHLINLVSLTPIGRQVRLSVWRGGKAIALTLTLADRNDLQQSSEAPFEPGMGAPIRKMGLTVHPLDEELANQLGYSPETKGLLILKVDHASQLSSQVQVYDVLEEVARKPVATVNDLEETLEELSDSQSLLIRVSRTAGQSQRPHVIIWHK
ncbi:PDZ domain-containing protein [bacterium]|nr:PDZ domain-containing protein [bacterium]